MHKTGQNPTAKVKNKIKITNKASVENITAYRDENREWIRQNVTQRLLEPHLKRDLKGGDHLLYRENAVIPNIKKKVGALWLVSKNLQKESRLRLANGEIMSRVLYLIQVWDLTNQN